MATLVVGITVVMVHKYTEWYPEVIALIGGVLLMYAVAALPIGVSERQRKLAALVQSTLLLLIWWSPIIWFVGFSGEMSEDEMKAMIPGGESAGAMLSPDGELIGRHKFSSPGHAIVEFVGVPIALVFLLWPFFGMSALILKRLMIIWYGYAPLIIAAAFLRVGWSVSVFIFLFGITAYAAKKPICPVSTLVVAAICAAISYSLAWLADPTNLHEIVGNEEK